MKYEIQQSKMPIYSPGQELDGEHLNRSTPPATITVKKTFWGTRKSLPKLSALRSTNRCQRTSKHGAILLRLCQAQKFGHAKESSSESSSTSSERSQTEIDRPIHIRRRRSSATTIEAAPVDKCTFKADTLQESKNGSPANAGFELWRFKQEYGSHVTAREGPILSEIGQMSKNFHDLDDKCDKTTAKDGRAPVIVAMKNEIPMALKRSIRASAA